MSYTKNPYMPKVRQEAALLVYQGWSTRKVGRHFGVGSSTISKWVKKDRDYGARPIPTGSSRPHHHPKELLREVVDVIIVQRMKRRRCAEVIHKELLQQGIAVSISSVKRTLKRHYLLRTRSPWKRWHQSDPRPSIENPGDLVQIDTIHIVPKFGQRFYVYALLDVCSRWAYAEASLRINTHHTLAFVRRAQQHAPFTFHMVQSDHGPEFSQNFTERIGVAHRHSRVRKPNDNAHIERFIRTLQEECFNKQPPFPAAYQRALNRYLPYYNGERLHLGLNLQTPLSASKLLIR